MLYFVYRTDFFGLRICKTNIAVEFSIGTDVHVLVDRRGKHCAAMLTVKRWEVAAAADKAHSERSLADNHELTLRIQWACQDPVDCLEKTCSVERGFGLPLAVATAFTVASSTERRPARSAMTISAVLSPIIHDRRQIDVQARAASSTIPVPGFRQAQSRLSSFTSPANPRSG